MSQVQETKSDFEQMSQEDKDKLLDYFFGYESSGAIVDLIHMVDRKNLDAVLEDIRTMDEDAAKEQGL